MITSIMTTNHPLPLFALLATTLLLAGCTGESEALTSSDNTPVPITPTLTINGMEATATRGAESSDAKYSYFRFEETGVGTGVFNIPTKLEDLILYNATRNPATGALTFAPTQYYSTDGRKCRFICFYPIPTMPVLGENGYHHWMINGTQDVMIAPRLEGSKTDRGINTFAFKHRLTQLQFFPFAETAGVANQWGKITKIEVLSQANEIRWPFANELTYNITAGTTTSDFTVAGINTTTAATIATGGKASATVQAGAATMIKPQNASNYVLTLRITTEKQGTKTITRTGTLLTNTPYRIYLRFLGQAIELAGFEQANIENWQMGSAKTGALTKEYPYVENGNTIVFQDNNGASAAADIHEPWTSNNMPYHNDFDWRWNSTPRKLEVAVSNVQNTWNDEWTNHTKCPAPWRMPTLKETCLILDYRERLVGVEPITTNLLTGTAVKSPSSNAWYAKITPTGNGGWTQISKGTNHNIRCVKDIE